MVLENRLSMGEFFFNFTLKNPPNCPYKAVHTKIHTPKKIVKGRSQIKSFYIIFF